MSRLWISRLFVAAASFASLSSAAAGAEKILALPSTGRASVVTLAGADTAQATVQFRQTEEDMAAGCFDRDEIHVRNDPAAREKLKADCAAKAKAPPPPTATRSANCPRLTVVMEADYMGGASFTLKGAERDGGYMRTTWRNNRTRERVSNCVSCGTPEINDTFRVLCPALYNKRFEGLEPF